MACTCGEDYRCKFCGHCLPHGHQRAWRLSEGRESVRKFFVQEGAGTIVNPGWNETKAGEEEWFWYHRVPGTLSADCWRRAIP